MHVCPSACGGCLRGVTFVAEDRKLCVVFVESLISHPDYLFHMQRDPATRLIYHLSNRVDPFAKICLQDVRSRHRCGCLKWSAIGTNCYMQTSSFRHNSQVKGAMTAKYKRIAELHTWCFRESKHDYLIKLYLPRHFHLVITGCNSNFPNCTYFFTISWIIDVCSSNFLIHILRVQIRFQHFPLQITCFMLNHQPLIVSFHTNTHSMHSCSSKLVFIRLLRNNSYETNTHVVSCIFIIQFFSICYHPQFR